MKKIYIANLQSLKVKKYIIIFFDEIKDFVGLPDDLMKYQIRKIKLRLPIPRTKKSTRDRHPLKSK